MNKKTAVFSILLLTSRLMQAEEILPQVETEVIEHTCQIIPGKLLHYEGGEFDWTGWSAEWNAVLFNQDNTDALESAQAAGLTVGTIQHFGITCTIVILDTDQK